MREADELCFIFVMSLNLGFLHYFDEVVFFAKDLLIVTRNGNCLFFVAIS